MSAAIPVTVLTGFLGSGKTTLLRHILAAPDYADCAVLINEFGEIGLDHHLVADVRGDAVLLKSGCVCCALRGDLADAIRDLYDRAEAGALPRFSRLFVETTGLADPAPIAATLLHEPVLRHHFRLGGIVTAVDAVNGEDQLDRQPEAASQAAAADRILLTKTDLAAPDAAARLERRLRRLNPVASIARSANAPPPPGWLVADAARLPPKPAAPAAGDQHQHAASSFVLTFDGALDWAAFGVWLTLLLDCHGGRVLRVKGLLNVAGVAGPVLLNGVQHLIHPPEHLPHWPDEDRRSRIVFIVRDLRPASIERSFKRFQPLLRPSALAA